MKESDVQRWVTNYLKNKFEDRIYIFKVPQAQYISRRGVPDLCMSIDGRFVAIEVKTEIGTLTKLQEYEIDRIRNANGLAYVIYGKNIDSLNDIIKSINNELGL